MIWSQATSPADAASRGARSAWKGAFLLIALLPAVVSGQAWSPAEILERAELLAAEGRLKEAVYLFQRYLKDDPQSARAVLGLARCQEGLGETDAALELFRRALALDPGLDEARSKLAEHAAPAAPPPAAVARIESPPPPAEADPAEPPPASAATVHSAEPETAPAVPAAGPPGETAPGHDNATETASPPAEPTSESAATESPQPPDPAETSGSAPAPSGEPERRTEPASGMPGRHAPERTNSGASRSLLAAGLLLAATAVALTLLLLRRRRRRGRCSIRGRLEKIPLPDVLQLLAMGGKEGVLEVTATSAGGRIWFRKGKIVAAQSGTETGETALFHVFSAAGGKFAFYEKPWPEEPGKSSELSVQEALLEWAEAVDDGNRDPSVGGALSLEEIEDEALNVKLPF